MSPGRADNLLFAAFIVIALAFAAVAVTYELSKIAVLVVLLVMGAAYLFISLRYLDVEPAYTSKEELEVTDQRIVFTDWLGEAHPIALDRLVSIAFTRYKALFQDLWFHEPMEQHLVLLDDDGESVAIPFHLCQTHNLVDWLGRRFPELDGDAADAAAQSKAEGRWVLWRRNGGSEPES